MDLEAFVGTGLQINDQTDGRALPLSHQEGGVGAKSHTLQPRTPLLWHRIGFRFGASVHFKTHYDEADWLLRSIVVTLLPTRLLIGRLEVMRWAAADKAGWRARWRHRQGPPAVK